MQGWACLEGGSGNDWSHRRSRAPHLPPSPMEVEGMWACVKWCLHADLGFGHDEVARNAGSWRASRVLR